MALAPLGEHHFVRELVLERAVCWQLLGGAVRSDARSALVSEPSSLVLLTVEQRQRSLTIVESLVPANRPCSERVCVVPKRILNILMRDSTTRSKTSNVIGESSRARSLCNGIARRIASPSDPRVGMRWHLVERQSDAISPRQSVQREAGASAHDGSSPRCNQSGPPRRARGEVKRHHRPRRNDLCR